MASERRYRHPWQSRPSWRSQAAGWGVGHLWKALQSLRFQAAGRALVAFPGGGLGRASVAIVAIVAIPGGGLGRRTLVKIVV